MGLSPMIRKLACFALPLALFCASAVTASAQAPAAAPATVTSSQPAVGGGAGADYILGAGDRVRVIVYGEAQLSGEFFVSPQGVISFPLIGDIPAAGRTVPMVIAEVTTRLKDGFVMEPRVSAEVLNYRPFYILGEVTRPGTYPFSSEMTVMNAVATAGGFTYRANRGTVYIKHANEQGEHKSKLTADTMVAPGDTVRIAERIF
jgi:polysaccharide export outer membrane protein